MFLFDREKCVKKTLRRAGQDPVLTRLFFQEELDRLNRLYDAAVADAIPTDLPVRQIPNRYVCIYRSLRSFLSLMDELERFAPYSNVLREALLYALYEEALFWESVPQGEGRCLDRLNMVISRLDRISPLPGRLCQLREKAMILSASTSFLFMLEKKRSPAIRFGLPKGQLPSTGNDSKR